MTKSNLFKTALSGLLCAAGIASASAQLVYNAEEFWSQPHIREAYLGNYELNTKTEPRLSETEQEVFRELLELMKTDKEAALQMLLTNITPESSGAMEFLAGSLYGERSDYENAMKYFTQAVDKYTNFLRI